MTLEQFKHILSYYEEYLTSADYVALDKDDKISTHIGNVQFIAWLARQIEEGE